jgi:hypothetical protein
MTGDTCIVVGAGPAGLGTAACLRGMGVDALVVDRAEAVASSWRALRQPNRDSQPASLKRLNRQLPSMRLCDRGGDRKAEGRAVSGPRRTREASPGKAVPALALPGRSGSPDGCVGDEMEFVPSDRLGRRNRTTALGREQSPGESEASALAPQ